MDYYLSKVKKIVLLHLVFFLSYTSIQAQDGKALFQQNCQSCHKITGASPTAPALAGVLERGPWAEDRSKLHDWVHNPAGFKDPYTDELKKTYGYVMTSFSNLTAQEIDAIIDYVNTPPTPTTTGPTSVEATSDNSARSAILFGVISLIMAIIALILMQVNSNLKKLSDDTEGIARPEPVPFWRNKIYIALFAIVFFVAAGYFAAKAAVGLGRQQGYKPDQPIYFSHKVHAGLNQINCQYCHSAVTESKHATIPSINVCMNCHKVVNSYEKGPKLVDENGNEIDGTKEIEKLYKYANYKPGPGVVWDPSKATPIEWVKIHNLPDHVYFSHSQHVKAGNVQCQTCHGNIQEMDKVEQKAELSMSWCVNCHRETKVAFNYNDSTGNRFYSIYEKFHNDFKAGKMDSITVKDIGGIECQKCHY
jgi:cytochrome c553